MKKSIERLLNIVSRYDAIKDEKMQERIYSNLIKQSRNINFSNSDIEEILDFSKDKERMNFTDMVRMLGSEKTENNYESELNILEKKLLKALKSRNEKRINREVFSVVKYIETITGVSDLRSRGFL